MFGLIRKICIGSSTGLVNGSNHIKYVSLINQKLIYIIMNTVKNFTTIHLHLNLIDVLEVVVLLMTYLIKNVFQIKQKS